MMRVWVVPVLLVLCGSAVAAGLLRKERPGEAVALLVVFLLLAATNSPVLFPRSLTAPEARRRSAEDGRPIVYWRPGCPFCMRLRMRVGRSARKMHWVNIWRDAAGAAEVRAVDDGNETVPTVVIGGRPYTNPDPAWVRDQLGRSR
ncbi:glutaredoxin domain-containing protein [Streptomyces sp. NPDC039028]|uniref:glutaredoxin domain-containing protein n=1 Tax=unclassified Streptomyces TaxID=2593676 RepID=UPI0033C53F99